MDRKRRKNIGIIGLGIIGTRVAASLRRAGFHVYVWNRSPRAEPNFLGSPAEVAALCDVIQLFVADDQALYEIIETLGQRLTASHVVICSATVAPAATVHAARMVEERGAKFLEAPFTGSRIAAEKGELVYFIGGDDEIFARVEEFLKGSSKAVVKMGEAGAAATVKIATNMMVAINVLALAEALALVKSASLAPEKLREALEHHAVRSPLIDMKLATMLSGDFEPHFSVKHMFKDIQIGRDAAEAAGLQIPATSIAESLLYRCIEENWGDLDFSSLCKLYLGETAGLAEAAEVSAPESAEQDQASTEPPAEENAVEQQQVTSGEEIGGEENQKSSLRRLFGL